jgi:hypothetical protein
MYYYPVPVQCDEMLGLLGNHDQGRAGSRAGPGLDPRSAIVVWFVASSEMASSTPFWILVRILVFLKQANVSDPWSYGLVVGFRAEQSCHCVPSRSERSYTPCKYVIGLLAIYK